VAVHELPLERATLHGPFSSERAPALTVDPGDAVAFPCLNAGWRWDPEANWCEDAEQGHALRGPVEVRGTRAGQTLVVRIDEVTPRQWGVTWGDGEAFSWRLEGDTWHSSRGNTVRSEPFLGVIGMPPPEPGMHSTSPPRRWGGNLDCKLLIAGTTLYLPIPVEGALLSAGDGHGMQGDGEVSGTAIECPLERAVLTLDVRDDLDLRMPVARIDGAWVAMGLDEDLDLAAEYATETMLDLMERELGVDRKYALALASVAVDLHVTQVVNGVKGVHAVLRDDSIR